MSHIFACLFYYVGESSKEHNSHNWIETLADDRLAFQYLTSLHWSLTQFTPASTNVHPMNTEERLFNVSVVICGLLIFSGLVSSITNSLMRLQQLEDERTRQFWLLNRFLRQRVVPTMLAARISGYIQHLVGRRGNHVQESSVTVLDLLTDGLKSELQYAITVRHVEEHVLFAFVNSVTNATIHRLWLAMQELFLASEEFLFYQDESACCQWAKNKAAHKGKKGK